MRSLSQQLQCTSFFWIAILGTVLCGGKKTSGMWFGKRESASKGSKGPDPSRRLFKLGSGHGVLAISKGDITKWEGDVIVNAANNAMLGGGGVDGAIHNAAGRELVEACRKVEMVEHGIRCRTGEAHITPGFRLKAKHVIHTAGPIYQSQKKSAPLLWNSYKNSLLKAREHGLESIAFPAISCGVYGYPQAEAAEIAMLAVSEFGNGFQLVEFVMFGQDTYAPFVAEATRQFSSWSEGGDAHTKGEDSKPKNAELSATRNFSSKISKDLSERGKINEGLQSDSSDLEDTEPDTTMEGAKQEEECAPPAEVSKNACDGSTGPTQECSNTR